MDLGLTNKVVLVLAASKGLGLACAKNFYKEGASVIICSRSRVNLDLARKEIEKSNSNNFNSRIITIETDLNDKEQIKSLVDTTIKEYGTIDVLVHNAGGPPSAPISNITEENWQDSINLNLLSFIRICKSV
ncbi:MAG: SDR family NAD(P)-dependent oxidoreductase, partial [Promethearchaeota archaeon]